MKAQTIQVGDTVVVIEGGPRYLTAGSTGTVYEVVNKGIHGGKGGQTVYYQTAEGKRLRCPAKYIRKV